MLEINDNNIKGKIPNHRQLSNISPIPQVNV